MTPTLTCPSCGIENASTAKFCSECGTAVAAVPVERREERKVVTVVFCDVVGSTERAEGADPEDVHAALQAFYARVRSELERFGGTVEKFIGDAVMAVFGAPVAHEDDPERAMRAALAIRDWAREQEGLKVRIAVNTGEALVALGARPESGEAMVAGDVVNTAARLQSGAPVNGILVGEATYRTTRHVVDFRPLETVEAKGKTDPIVVHEAVAVRSRADAERARMEVPLIGRAQELDALGDALARAGARREPQFVTIIGVPGIGKSRLVAELHRTVADNPDITVTWRRGRSLPYGEGTPLYAFAEIVKAHSGILDSDSAAEAAEKLRETTRRAAPQDAESLEQRLRPLVGLEGPSLTSADARAQSFAAWRRWIEAVAGEGPLVLVFEDIHWADDDLLDFVDHVVDWATDVPVLVIATARPELLERRPGWGGGKRNALTISLAALDGDETAHLLSELLGRAVLPADTQAELIVRAGGNPLYAEQFAALVREGGAANRVPESVQGIIAARLDALASDEKRLLQRAAVVGRQFWVGALSTVGGEDRELVEQRLHRVQRKEFIHRERSSTVAEETEFAFAHALLRDVTYGQIPRGERAALHRAVAAWLEGLAPDRAEDRADMLAHHYLAALELQRARGEPTAELEAPARRALRDAGERALTLGAFRSAERLFARALELWPQDDPDRLVIEVRHAEAAFYRYKPPDVQALSAAADSLARGGDAALAAKAEVIAAVTQWWSGRGDASEGHVARAVELVRDAPRSPEKAMVLAECARLCLLAGRSQEALAFGAEALEMAEQLDHEEIAAQSLATLGAIGVEVEARVDLLRKAVERGRRVMAVQPVLRAHGNLADVWFQHRDLDDGADEFRAARAFAERYADPYALRWLDAAECVVAYLSGDWASAEARASAFIAEVARGSPHHMESSMRHVRSDIRLARADDEGALADGECGLTAARQVRDPETVGASLASFARVLVTLGRIAEATALVDELLALEGEHGGFAYYQWIIDSAWLARDTDRVDTWWARAAREPPSRYLAIGEAVARGDDAAAADLLADKGHVTEAAYARLQAAAQLAQKGGKHEAHLHLERALAFYRSVEATRYMREGEALLAASA